MRLMTWRAQCINQSLASGIPHVMKTDPTFFSWAGASTRSHFRST